MALQMMATGAAISSELALIGTSAREIWQRLGAGDVKAGPAAKIDQGPSKRAGEGRTRALGEKSKLTRSHPNSFQARQWSVLWPKREISSRSQFEYQDFRFGITMRLPLTPIYTTFPGDYRTREQAKVISFCPHF
jgi:hypothetical protein